MVLPPCVEEVYCKIVSVLVERTSISLRGNNVSNNDWNSSLYDQKHAFVYEYGRGLIPVLDPQPGELILDLGCGTGHLTQTIAESGAHVIGIDSSASMIETAQITYPHLEFLVADAKDFFFASPFDAIFSNATLHWIVEAEQVARC